MISNAWFHRIKAAQRDLIRLVGGIERAADISSISKSHIGRMNNATDPELMPLHAVYALESECGVPVVTSAMAELNGRRLADPEGERAAEQCVVVTYSEMVRKAGDLISGGAVAISDMVVTSAEATKMDRDAAELEAGLAAFRNALASVKANGGHKVTFYAGAFNGKLADGKDVFHADHGNLAAAGSAITVDSVGDGRKAMGLQKSIDKKPLLANPARIMLVGPNQLTEAEKLLASITPATVSTVNIFSGKFELVETSQIADNSWNLFADPVTGSNYRWGYLEGYEAPRVRMDEPFGSQGFSMSVEHDFGCGATDFRFGYRNPGQA